MKILGWLKTKKSGFAIPLGNKIFVLIIQALINQGLPAGSFQYLAIRQGGSAKSLRDQLTLSLALAQRWVSAASFIGKVYKKGLFFCVFFEGVAATICVKDCYVLGIRVSGPDY